MKLLLLDWLKNVYTQGGDTIFQLIKHISLIQSVAIVSTPSLTINIDDVGEIMNEDKINKLNGGLLENFQGVTSNRYYQAYNYVIFVPVALLKDGALGSRGVSMPCM